MATSFHDTSHLLQARRDILLLRAVDIHPPEEGSLHLAQDSHQPGEGSLLALEGNLLALEGSHLRAGIRQPVVGIRQPVVGSLLVREGSHPLGVDMLPTEVGSLLPVVGIHQIAEGILDSSSSEPGGL